MPIIRQIQIGKQGVTENFIESLKKQFLKCKTVKISVLKSACRDREGLRKIREKILSEFGNNYTAKVIGFTIVLKRWRKSKELK